MIKEITPSRIALCVMLAQQNHMLGVLLFLIVHWDKYGAAKIPGVDGKWVANTREWWRLQAQLSPAQLDRGLAMLEACGLIERCQWWFGRRNILHVRPTKMSLDYLAIATTWQSAKEFLPTMSNKKPPLSLGKSAKHSSTQLPNSVGQGAGSGTSLGSAVLLNSNNIVTGDYNKTHGCPSSAHPATPTCGLKKAPQEESGKNSGKKKSGNLPKKLELWKLQKQMSSEPLKPLAIPNISDVISAWDAVLECHYPSQALGPWTAKQKGMIASALQSLSYMHAPDGEVDLRHRACDIFGYAARHWSELGMIGPRPDPKSIDFDIGLAVSSWHKAGQPKIDDDSTSTI